MKFTKYKYQLLNDTVFRVVSRDSLHCQNRINKSFKLVFSRKWFSCHFSDNFLIIFMENTKYEFNFTFRAQKLFVPWIFNRVLCFFRYIFVPTRANNFLLEVHITLFPSIDNVKSIYLVLSTIRVYDQSDRCDFTSNWQIALRYVLFI